MTGSRPRQAMQILVATMFASAMGCAADSAPAEITSPAHSVSMMLDVTTLRVGQTAQAHASARDETGAELKDVTLTWKASDSAVATVSGSGLITAVAVGQTVVSASVGGKSASAAITVVPVPVASVGVTLSAATVAAGQGVAATATLRDSGGVTLDGRELSWESSDHNVALISSAGAIMTLSPGTTSISATSEGITGTATLTVQPASVAAVTVTLEAATVQAGRTTRATADVRDANGNLLDRPIAWNSNKTSVATVSTNGTVTAVAAGTASINARAENVTGSATVTVTTAPPPLTTTQAVASRTGSENTAIDAFVPVTASGGSTPYTFALNGGSLPTGMTFNTSNGRVSGTPTAALATTTFTVTVTDAVGATSSKAFQLTVSAATPPLSTVRAVAAVNGTVGTAIDVTPVTASGGASPYSFNLGGGSLPAGLNFSANSGRLSGTPSASIAATVFTVTVSDASAATSSKTFTLTVNPSGSTTTSECATPRTGWIFCDDFESNRLSSYFEYEDAGGRFVRTPSAGVGGSVGMRATFATGESDAGALHLAFGRTPSSYFRAVDAGTSDYREIYWRFYVYRSPGWVGNGPNKLTRATVFAKGDFSQAMIAHGWTSDADDRYLFLDPASGTDDAGNLITVGYNDFNHLRWLGGIPTAAPEEDQAHVGQWACYEFHVKLNDAGQSNGLFELLINGQTSARKTGMNWIGAYNAYGINAVYLENFQNDGAPGPNVRTLDNFVVSTQPIGCLP